ncbi:MAG: hypothetical protein AB1428_01940 [Bacteroidota bacterium]
MSVASRHKLGCTVVAVCLAVTSHHAFAQGSAGTAGKLEPRYLTDVPTAGMIDKGNFAVDIDFYRAGGVLVGFSAGIFNRVSMGISYGGSKLIGGESPELNETPGVNVKIRVAEEGMLFPALVLGFDSQGKEGYIKSLSRYAIKSPGLYAVVSKNYAALGYLSLHGGVNYSFERADGDKDPNVFVGLEKTIGPIVSMTVEYSLGLNDNGGDAIGRGKGYLNAALKVTLGSGLTLGVNMKDLLKNGEDLNIANRTVHIEFSKPF